jgi:hypothetical protein
MRLKIVIGENVLNGITTESLEAMEPMLLSIGKTDEMVATVTETFQETITQWDDDEDDEVERTVTSTRKIRIEDMQANGDYSVVFAVPPPPRPIKFCKLVGEQAEVEFPTEPGMTVNMAITKAMDLLGFSMDLSQVTVVVDADNQTTQYPESLRNEPVREGSIISILAIGKPSRG